jgi:sterol 3beta-glucosyltransferase
VAPADLLAFLGAGAPPVVLTMGSMVMFDPGPLAQTFVRALRLAGQRGVLVGGWSGAHRSAALGGPVYCVEEAPYDWLFPRASCVIHHGGCGTVAAVLRAGKPSVVLPQIMPQELFGNLLGRNGLATAVFQTDVLTPPKLALAIHEAATNQDFHRNARLWQQVIGVDPGVQMAADLIERHWRSLQAA